MRLSSKQSGLTLTEMTVVIASIVLLAAIGLPAIRAFIRSFETESGTRATISAALASARAMAAQKQRYTGIRFQKTYHPQGPIHGAQYIVFIIQDPNLTGTYGYGFRAVPGIEPIKLPDSIGVTDLTIVPDRNKQNPVNPGLQIRIDIVGDTAIDTDIELIDTTTFSIIFSPSGKLVTHGIWVRNRDSKTDNSSLDDIFNTAYNVETAKIAKFHQDDYFANSGNPNLGLGPEPSRIAFVIYEAEKFNLAYLNKHAWSQYLYQLTPTYINPYTGTIVSNQQ
jgi:type II secretory pathway pseudopilin PulG